MIIKTINFIFLCLLFFSFSLAHATSLSDNESSAWSKVSKDLASVEKEYLDFLPEKYGLYSLNEDDMRNALSTAARKSKSATADSNQINLPLPDGQSIKLTLTESSVMAPELAAKYPDIKIFKVQGVDRPEVTGTIGINTLGFHGMLFTENGERIFIDRREKEGRVYYLSYHAKAYRPTEKKAFSCGTKNNQLINNFSTSRSNQTLQRPGSSIRTYRIAIGATGEYTAVFGGTKAGALSAITTTLARVNEMYERDLSVSMTLVANNDDVIYTDASTDPFTNNNPSTLISESQTEMNTTIGSANYDIGHTFSTGAGGLASLGVVCNNNFKARGVTGISNPQTDVFDIDYVAHEIGHQFSGNHTFNGEISACGAGNRNASTAFEPGSASTILSFAGICGSDNLQSNTDAMFHSKSIEEMGAFIDNTGVGGGGSCGTSPSNSNNQPTASAGSDYTIPASTPFELTGSGSDTNSSDTLTYSWEQIDAGTSSAVNVDEGNNAIFRTFLPVSSATRIFPKISDILTGTTSKGEILPSTSRTLNFRLVVRDQKGGVGIDDTAIMVDSTGNAFAITSHTTSATITAGSSINVIWNAGNTAFAPISCSNVDILLSADGGNTFSTTLEAATPNDGDQTVTIPSSVSANTTTRLKVKCSDNIFFDISDVDLTLEAVVTTNSPPVANNDTLAVVFNTAKTGTLTATDSNTSDTLTYSIVSNGSKGTVNLDNATTGAYTYTPTAGQTGNDTFTFKANDATVDSNTATVTVTIAEEINTAPAANNDTLAVVFNTAKTGTLTATDGNTSDTLTYRIVSNGSKGTVNLDNATTGAYTYTPTAGQTGNDTFTFKANDATVDSNTATVTVTIAEEINTAPAANNGTLAVVFNTAKTGTLTATDANTGDTLTYSLVNNGSKGSVTLDNTTTGAYTYTPTTGQTGTDTFTFKANDGTADSNTAMVTVTIKAATGGGGSIDLIGMLTLLGLLFLKISLRSRGNGFLVRP